MKKLKKSASVQIDERVDARIADKMDSTVVDTVQHILVDNLKNTAFKDSGPRKHKKKHGSGRGDKKHKSGQSNVSFQQTSGYNPPSITVTSKPLTTTNTILPSQFVQPIHGLTNNEQNIQYVAIPFDQTPQLSFNEFRAGRSMHTGRDRGTFRSGSIQGRRGRDFYRSQGENDAYSMDVAPVSIFENQVIPMGLHNLSKSF